MNHSTPVLTNEHIEGQVMVFQGSEQERLAAALADKDFSPHEIHRLLRWWGFRGFTLGLESFLTELSELESSFIQLALLYPNLESIAKNFTCARKLKINLESALLKRRSEAPDDLEPLEKEAYQYLEFDTRDSTGPEESIFLPRKSNVQSDVPNLNAKWLPTNEALRLAYCSALSMKLVWRDYRNDLQPRGMKGFVVDILLNPRTYALIEDPMFASQMSTYVEPCIPSGFDTLPQFIEEFIKRVNTYARIYRHSPTVFDRLVDQVLPFKNFLDLLGNSHLDSGYKSTYGNLSIDASQPASEETIDSEQDIDLEEEVGSKKEVNTERKRRPFHWGSAASSDLKDRALLMDWTYGFDDSQRASISQYFDPNRNTQVVERSGQELSAPEVAFLKAAIFTSRLLSESPNLRVLSLKSKSILDEYISSLPPDIILSIPHKLNLSNTNEIHWKTRRAKKTGLTLTIGEFSEIQSNLCSDFYIHELFPFPPEHYVTNATNKLILSLSTSKRRLGLCIKHELARRMFAFNANRAVIEFVCGSALDENVDIGNESLTSYIHPNSHCIHESYRNAIFHLAQNTIRQSEIIKNSEHFESVKITDDEACRHIPTEGMRKIVDYLKSELDLGHQSDPIAFHNQYVLYVLSLLLAGTGHRNTDSPFHFSFCFDFSEMVAFISDKNVVGSEARFVPITQMMIEQIVQFRLHLLWLADYMRSSGRPELANQIEIASGIAIGREYPQEKSHSTGFFFIVQDEKLLTITCNTVDSHLIDASSRSQFQTNIKDWTKALRRNLATFVSEFCPGGFHVEMLLGHNGEMHLFGPSSCWIPLEQYSVVRPLIERYMEVNNWSIVTAQWVRKSHRTFDPAMPTYVQSSKSYEGISLSADAARARARQAIMSTLPIEETEDPHLAISVAEMEAIRRGLSRTLPSNSGDREMLLSEFDKLIGDWKVDSGYEVSATTILTPLNLASAVQERMVTDGQSQPLDSKKVLYAVCLAIEDIVGRDKLRKEDTLMLDDAEVQKIRERIHQSLGSDHEARTKVLSEFNRLSSGWRKGDRYRISSARVNLARYAEGSIPITFGRHLAIARHAEIFAASEIKRYLDEDRSSVVRYLSVLAILLPLTEAVININDAKSLLDAIQDRKSEIEINGTSDIPFSTEIKNILKSNPAFIKYENAIEIRSTVESRTAFYDRTLDPTFIGSAAIVSYLKLVEASERYSFGEIEKNANELLNRIYSNEESITYAKFIQVMHPYWFLRLPASIFASCAGQLDCNAPSESSTSLLLGIESPALAIPAPKIRTSSLIMDDEIEDAKNMAILLLRNAEGSVVNRDASSKLARQRLRKKLGGMLNIDLLEIMNRVQAFDLWISFLVYMLVIGGKRKNKLAFRTLKNYQYRMLKHYLKIAWNEKLLNFTESDFYEFYTAIIDNLNVGQEREAYTVLRLFHRFLRADYSVPPCSLFPPERKLKRFARNVVIPFKNVNEAIDLLKQNTKRLGRATSVSAGGLLAVDCAWGLRPMEGFGLDARNFGCVDHNGLKLRRNTTRSLKTKERTIPLSLSDEYRNATINERAKISNITTTVKGIFTHAFMSNPEDHALSLDPADVMAAANWSIKCSTGDIESVSYSVRHLFGTSLMSHITLKRPSYSVIAMRISTSLEIPETAKYAIELLKPCVDIYPFQPDRIGMWMGHQSVSTLATTYWHGSWFVTGEYTAREACKFKYTNVGKHHRVWNDGVIASILNCSRTKIVEVRKLVGVGIAEEMQYQRIVEYFVNQANIDTLAPITSSIDVSFNAPVYVSKLSLKDYDELLLRRAAQTKYDEVALIQNAHDELGVPKIYIKNFYDAYMNVANELVFTDYEPTAIPGNHQKSIDLDRGALKRMDIMDRIEEKFSIDESFQERTLKIVSDWRKSVDSKKPFLISYGTDQCLKHIDWLIEIGYEVSNISVSHHGLQNSVREIFANKKISLSSHDKQFGRTGFIGKEYEFGVSVDHSRTCPSGRELHRVLFALSIFMDSSGLKY